MKRLLSSLTGRLIVWFVVAQSLLAVAALAITFVLWPQPGDHDAFAHMNAARVATGALRMGPDGRLVVADTPALAAFRRARPQVRLAVLQNGRPLAGSSPDLVTALEAAGRPRFANATFAFTRGPLAGAPVAAVQQDTPWGPVEVVSAGNRFRLADLPTLAGHMGAYMVKIMGVACLGSALFVPFVIRGALRPLNRASAEAARIDLSARGLRLPDGAGVPSELVSLARSINTALARLDEGFGRQQRFAAQAAHEMRTPLAILAARIDSQPPGEFTDALRRDVDRMRKLVDQLLLAARLERRETPLDEPLDLVAVTRDVVADCAPLALAQGKALAFAPALERLPTRGGVAALESALTNLIGNALRAEPPGGAVQVRVAAEGRVFVADHGPGVAVEDRERIFEPFWRRDHSTSGAGLGLTIVKEAVAAHGGEVGVDDTPGGGATFWIRIPLRPAQPPREAASAVLTPLPASPP